MSYFGNAVSMSGSTVVVGAPGSYDNGWIDAAYIYYGCDSVSSSTCKNANKVTLYGPAEASSSFGFSVSISGSTVVVGASGYNNQGAAYIYYGCTSAASSTCTDNKRVTLYGAGIAGSGFGGSVSISGSTIVVGTGNVDSQQGAAYIYYGCDLAASSTCTDTHKVTLQTTGCQGFGYSVSISGSTVVVGGSSCTEGSIVYIYYGCNSPSSSNCTDTNRATLNELNTLHVSNTGFGLSVSISGSTIVVGAPYENMGATYIYYGCTSASSSTCTNSNREKLYGSSELNTNSLTPNYFSNSVFISGSTVIVAADIYNTNQELGEPPPLSCGSYYCICTVVYIYYGCTSPSSLCSLNVDVLYGPSEFAPDSFQEYIGTSVILSGSTIIVGSSNYDNYHGVTYIYYDTQPTSTPTISTTLPSLRPSIPPSMSPSLPPFPTPTYTPTGSPFSPPHPSSSSSPIPIVSSTSPTFVPTYTFTNLPTCTPSYISTLPSTN